MTAKAPRQMPAAPSPLPLPYPIMGSSSNLDPGTEKTKVNGKKVLNSDGKVKKMKVKRPAFGSLAPEADENSSGSY